MNGTDVPLTKLVPPNVNTILAPSLTELAEDVKVYTGDGGGGGAILVSNTETDLDMSLPVNDITNVFTPSVVKSLMVVTVIESLEPTTKEVCPTGV